MQELIDFVDAQVDIKKDDEPITIGEFKTTEYDWCYGGGSSFYCGKLEMLKELIR